MTDDERFATWLQGVWIPAAWEQIGDPHNTIMGRYVEAREYIGRPPTEQEVRDQAVLDGFIEKYKALADEHGVTIHAGDSEAWFMRGHATHDAEGL